MSDWSSVEFVFRAVIRAALDLCAAQACGDSSGAARALSRVSRRVRGWVRAERAARERDVWRAQALVRPTVAPIF